MGEIRIDVYEMENYSVKIERFFCSGGEGLSDCALRLIFVGFGDFAGLNGGFERNIL